MNIFRHAIWQRPCSYETKKNKHPWFSPSIRYMRWHQSVRPSLCPVQTSLALVSSFVVHVAFADHFEDPSYCQPILLAHLDRNGEPKKRVNNYPGIDSFFFFEWTLYEISTFCSFKKPLHLQITLHHCFSLTEIVDRGEIRTRIFYFTWMILISRRLFCWGRGVSWKATASNRTS